MTFPAARYTWDISLIHSLSVCLISAVFSRIPAREKPLNSALIFRSSSLALLNYSASLYPKSVIFFISCFLPVIPLNDILFCLDVFCVPNSKMFCDQSLKPHSGSQKRIDCIASVLSLMLMHPGWGEKDHLFINQPLR